MGNCCKETDMPEVCTRCNTPMVSGHGLVCSLKVIANVALALGIVELLSFWYAAAVGGQLFGYDASLLGISSCALLILSLVASMQAKWRRHEIVAIMDDFLIDGSCCGGSCAGSCGDAEPELSEEDISGCGDCGCGNGQCGA